MATHKSAKKRARQALVRRDRNRQYISSVRTAVKTFKAAIASNESKEALLGLFTTAQTALAKAAQKGLLHKNNASRRIGRLAASLSKLSGSEATAAATTKKAPAKKAAAKKPAAKAKAKAAPKKKAATKKK